MRFLDRRAELDCPAAELRNRRLPPGVPPHAERVLFVPAAASRATRSRHGVRIVTAERVLRALQ
jgi:hypothetical protein